MPLSTRPRPYSIPSYSLTGDLLAYLNCGLQYRYQNRGALPPSKPVQLWFGQFIHGVLEEAFRFWAGGARPLPWTATEIDPIVERIQRRLEAAGVTFQRVALLAIAVERAYVVINELGPLLFPSISEAEVRLQGVRDMPPTAQPARQSDYYEVAGVVDVVTSAGLQGILGATPLQAAVIRAVANRRFEAIVDYKGMRRPSLHSPQQQATWAHHEWQIQTYAWLREQQPTGGQVLVGLLLYLNELVPSAEDMEGLYLDVTGHNGRATDVLPAGNDLAAVNGWRGQRRSWRSLLDPWNTDVRDWWTNGLGAGQAFPRMPPLPNQLSRPFRLERTFRAVLVDPQSVASSLDHFDQVVEQIEISVARESSAGRVANSWRATPADQTCTVCDFRRFCPAPGNAYRGPPTAP